MNKKVKSSSKEYALIKLDHVTNIIDTDVESKKVLKFMLDYANEDE